MSNILWKKFNLCFSKIKCLSPPLPPPSLTPSENQNQPPPKNSILIKNYNSIYDLTTNSTSSSHTDDFFFSSSSADEFSEDAHTTKFTPPDFATLFASQRFFFSSPGRSNSIFECSSPDTPPKPDTLVDGGVAFSKYSPDPYKDFRRSMQEMLKARDDQLFNVKDNLDYLHELLLCFLTLNPKHTHKYIISAFSDLVVVLMSEKSPNNVDDHRRGHVPRQFLLM